MTTAYKPTPTHPAYPIHVFAGGVWHTQVIERIKRTAGVLQFYSRQWPLTELYDATSNEIIVVSEFYPALNGAQTVTADGSDADGEFLTFTPASMDPNLVEGFNDGDGTLYGVDTWSQIAFAATYLQLDMTVASGVTVELYGRIHKDAEWALLGTFVEGVDDNPTQVMFDEPMNETQFRGNDDNTWQAFAQRSGLK